VNVLVLKVKRLTVTAVVVRRLMLWIVVTSVCHLCCRSASGQDNVITIEQFDSWIFSQMRDEASARVSLKSRIELEIERRDRVASLSDQQKAKIRLAGTGDIKRFFDQVRRARQDFIALGLVERNNINEAYQLASPLSQRLSTGIFDKESLLKKVSMTVQDAEQAEAIDEYERQRLERKKGIAIKSQVAQLGRSVPLTAVQRERLIRLIDESLDIQNCPENYYATLIHYRLSEVPKSTLLEFLDKPQVRALENVLPRGANIKAALIQKKVIDE